MNLPIGSCRSNLLEEIFSNNVRSSIVSSVIIFSELMAKVCVCASIIFAIVGAALANYGASSGQAFLFFKATMSLGLTFAAITTIIDKVVKIKLGIIRSLELIISASTLKFTHITSGIATVVFASLGLVTASLENPCQGILFQFTAGSAFVFLITSIAQSILKAIGWNEYKIIEQAFQERDQAKRQTEAERAAAERRARIAEMKAEERARIAEMEAERAIENARHARIAEEEAKERAIENARIVEMEAERAIKHARIAEEEAKERARIAEMEARRAIENARHARIAEEEAKERAIENARIVEMEAERAIKHARIAEEEAKERARIAEMEARRAIEQARVEKDAAIQQFREQAEKHKVRAIQE